MCNYSVNGSHGNIKIISILHLLKQVPWEHRMGGARVEHMGAQEEGDGKLLNVFSKKAQLIYMYICTYYPPEKIYSSCFG